MRDLSGVTEAFVESDGVRLWTVSQGVGDTVMLCNGGAGCCDYLGPVAAMIDDLAKVKRQPGRDVLIFGSADLVNALVRHDLIDEYRLMVFPVVVGKGKQLFGDGIDTKALEVVGTEMLVLGVVVLTYRPAGMETEG
jgi:hypothetical protein